MAARGQHRQALVWAAARLFRRQGFTGTGLSDILAASGAPRGSLYHYFPAGKEEIGAEAVAAAGGLVTRTLKELADEAPDPASFIRRYTEMLAQWLKASDYRDGCPITTTLLETAPGSERITAAGRAAFADWQAIVGGLLRRHGWPEGAAARTATAVIAGLEGALLMARVQGSGEPVNAITDALCALVERPPQE